MAKEIFPAASLFCCSNNEGVMRCFIAIDMPDNIKELIGGVIERCKGQSKCVRWVSPENIHLTLKFLGDVSEKLLPDIEKGLSSVCRNHAPFTITICSVGSFPSFKYPNVYWVGIDKSKELKNLYRDLEIAMAELGFESESRPFSPHITIGRVKDKKGIDSVAKELYTLKDAFFGSIEVKEILLMRSILKPTGAEHCRIAVFNLRSKSE